MLPYKCRAYFLPFGSCDSIIHLRCVATQGACASHQQGIVVQKVNMALREGALRMNFLANRNFYQFKSVGLVRTLSEKVSIKPKPSSAPETTGDHLLYTQEHLALKDSLRKV